MNTAATSSAAEPLSLTEAFALFEHLSNMENIAFGFVREGCYARAHLMCREMESRGYAPQKAWAFEKDENNRLFFMPADDNMQPMAYWYHVAPAMEVRLPDGRVETCVFDPGIYDGPELMSRWLGDLCAPEGYSCVAPFGEGPFGSKSDYKPEDLRDPRRPILGEETGPATDDDAQQAMDRHLYLLKNYGFQRRVLYTSQLRDDADAALPAPLPREGRGWVSLSLHNARESGNIKAEEKMTGTARPLPPPKRG